MITALHPNIDYVFIFIYLFIIFIYFFFFLENQLHVFVLETSSTLLSPSGN